MNLRLSALDEEIHFAEQLIVQNRMALDDALSQSAQRARNKARATLTSPAFLIGAGSLLAYFLFGKRRGAAATAAPVKKSLWGIVGAGVFSLVQARFGGPVGLAQWIIARTASRRHISQPQHVEF